MIQILHNPRCSKSRSVLKFLTEKGLEVEEIRYLYQPLTTEEIRNILKKLNIKPLDWVRKNEALFKTQFKDKQLSNNQWIEILANNPRLIERPVVINGDKAVIGRPLEKVLDII
jgi:arsenate reductase